MFLPSPDLNLHHVVDPRGRRRLVDWAPEQIVLLGVEGVKGHLPLETGTFLQT